jgi:[ribosomal protein S5]-alanine N-acetyltransferase
LGITAPGWIVIDTIETMPILHSIRLRLEPLRATHADDLFLSFCNPSVYDWISTQLPETAEVLAKSWTCSGDNGPFYYDACFGLDWAVVRNADNRVIGKFDADFDDCGRAINLGFVFEQDVWGQGYASEAIRRLLTEFDRCAISEVRAYVTKGNLASMRVLERTGFQFIRIIPDNDIIKGQLFDDLEYVRKKIIDM